ncbi:hypothetical protein L1Z23_17690, partial [Acinetobacter baumannii]|nr:hypothetical protein [Acinetobacter baumannii]
PFGEIIANNYVPDEKKQNSSVKEPA